jgi:hypothetical protein
MSLDYGDEVAATEGGVRNAWDWWLSQHDSSLPETIEGAVRAGWDEWLATHTAEIVAAIAAAAAKRPQGFHEGVE